MATTSFDYLSKLPGELLENVLHHLAAAPETPYQEWLQARLTCKRWNEILEPIAFRALRFCYDHDPHGGARVSAFLFFLNLKPSLAQYVMLVCLDIRKNDDWIYTKTSQILDVCTKLHSIELKVKLEDVDLPVLYLKAVHQRFLRLLKKIALLNLRWIGLTGVSFDCIIATFATSPVDELVLTQCAWSGSETNPVPGGWDLQQCRHETAQIYQGTGNIRCIHIVGLATNVDQIAFFLKWPAALEEFRFCQPWNVTNWLSRYHDPEFDEFYSPEPLYQMVHPQRKSLKTFRYYNTIMNKFQADFSNMRALNTVDITFSYLRDLHIRLPSLSAPKLKTLIIQYQKTQGTRIEENLILISHFCDLFEILSASISNADPQRKPRLQEIQVIQSWTINRRFIYPLENTTPHHEIWPDDWLHVAQRLMAQHGIRVTYEGPTWKWNGQAWVDGEV